METKLRSYKRRAKGYRRYIKKPEYSNIVDKAFNAVKTSHYKQDKSGIEFEKYADSIMSDPVVQSMKKYNHHSHTSCYQHSVHVAYFNYLICKKLGWDTWAATKGGLLHDMFLYDWHEYDHPKDERLHGFEHPNKALKNAKDRFGLTRKEGDIIKKHMFPLTITPPSYKESYVIVMTDKICSTGEVFDRFFKAKRKRVGAKVRASK